MNFYKRWIGDYRSKTARLTPLEHGIYNLLLDEHYATEEPLPLAKTELFQIVGARTPVDEAAVDKVLTRYWIEAESGWTNSRAMKEIAAFREKSNKASGAAHMRWDSERNANAHANAHANASETHMPAIATSQTPEPKPRTTAKKKDTSARQVARQGEKLDFELFKSVYPERSGSQPWARAVKAANARVKEGANFHAMLEGAKRYAEFCDEAGKTGTEFVMQAATFLGPEQHFLQPWSPPANKSEVLEQRNRQHAVDFLERDNR